MQAAANLYIPKSVEAGNGAGAGNGKTRMSTASAPARPADEPLSPFVTVPLGDSDETPAKVPEEVIYLSLLWHGLEGLSDMQMT